MIHKKTLLIIDDEPSILASLVAFFEDTGYTALAAENGQKGLDIYFKNDIDVVLTDLRMPGKNGFEVMEAIHAVRPKAQILVVSGADKKQDILRALRMGAKDYITKPIVDLEMVSHAVNRAFENNQLNIDNQRYQSALEKSEHHYRTITENIAEGVLAVDKDEHITYVNKAFCSITGYPVESLISKSLKSIANKRDFRTIHDEIGLQKKGGVSRFEIQLHHKTLKPVQVELACNPLFSKNNQYHGFIAVVRDISELTQLREKFKHFLSSSKPSDSNIISICASCKKIKHTEKTWVPVEDHFSDTVFSHSICPDCCATLYPQFDFSEPDSDPESD